MKVMIDIPKEFESDLQDKFNEFFERMIADIDYALEKQEPLLCGNYERETAEMFLSAFNEVIVFDDMTNGEVLETVFSNAENIRVDNGYTLDFVFAFQLNRNYKDWWNAPYKKGAEE